jgi:tetratricopeptide (TPR) repeat protein
MHTFSNIGQKSMGRGNYKMAEKYYKKSLEILEGLNGKDCLEAVAVHKELGSILKYQESYKAAQKEYEKCLAILDNIKGSGSIDRA